MIKISKLLPYKFYRASSPVLSYVDISNTRKNVMVSIMAPSYSDELKFLASEHIVFKSLTKIYQERITQYKYHNKPLVRAINDSDDLLVTTIQERYPNNPNLREITQVIRPLPNAKTDVLKGFNYLYEANHVLNNILNNDKDTRVASYYQDELIKYFAEYYKNKIKGILDYKYKVLYIPVDLWLDKSNFTDTKTFVKTNKNFISLLYNIFLNKEEEFKKIFADYKIILVNKNELMILDPSVGNEEPYSVLLKSFLRKCKSNENYASTEVSDIDTADEIKKIEMDAEKDEKVDEILAKSKVNLNALTDDKLEKLKGVIASELDVDNPTISEKDIKDIKNADQIDTILNAKLSGMSVANYQRNEMLKEKYKTAKFKDRNIEDIINDSSSYDIPKLDTEVNTINESFKSIRANDFAKAYNENLSDKDIMKILLHFMKCKPGLFLISDPQIEDVSDTINRLYRYTVEYEDENRKRHKFSFLMPKFYMDKYLFFNESKWDITHQKFPYPATKIKANEVQMCGNYNKIFMTRAGQNISPRMTKLKKIFFGNSTPSYIKIFPGDVTQYNLDIMSTIEYGEFGKILSRLNINDTSIYFNHSDAEILIKPSKNTNYIPLAINNKTKRSYYLDSTSNLVFDEKDVQCGELSEFLVELMSEKDKKVKDEFDKMAIGSKFSYTEATLLGRHIPLILVLAASFPVTHLKGILELSKIPYEISEKRVNVDKTLKGVIQFSDCYLIYDRYPYENSLLLNGLSVVNTREYTFNDMNVRDTYIDIFDTLYNSRTIIDGLENFHYLFVDPITEEVCERLGIPSTYESLLLYGSGLLADNSYDIDSSYRQCRIRSNEIVNVYLYQALCDAYKNYKIGRSPKFSIAENAVLKLLVASPIVDPHTQLNIVKNVENDMSIKMNGPVGLNLDEAYTLEKRAFSDSMQGLVALNTTPSGEVGITRHMTLNRNILDARGFIEVGKESYDGSELLSAGELMNTFAVESADAERVAMAISQTKHLVPVENSSPSLITFDMGRVLPKIATDFSFVAEDDGEILDIIEDVMIVKYKSGKITDIDMSSKADKNSDGGFYITNKMKTEYSKGSKFKKGSIIAYNPKQIGDKDMFGDYCATEGTLARVVINSSGPVYEDSTKVTHRLAKKLSSKITTVKNITISKHSNIKFMAKKGDYLEANDPLLLFDDTKDEFTSALLASIAEESGDETDIVANGAPIISKTGGTITDIKIYYTVPMEEMTPSLKKVIKEYSDAVSKREKAISKYMDIRDSNTILTPSTQIQPDSMGKVKGVEVGEGVYIQFFIEYLDVYGVGDKIT